MGNPFDQFDQPQARLSQPANPFDQFDQDDQPAQAPVQTPERAALQAELDKRLNDADSAGKRLGVTEFVADKLARPLLSGLTTAADASPIVSLPRSLGNIGIRGVNKFSGSKIPEIPAITPQSLAPRNVGERFAAAVTGGVSGALGGVGIGQGLAAGAAPVASRVGQVLASNPGLQAAGATTGAIAGQGVAEAGGGPGAQFAASLVGGLAPSATLQSIGRAATKLGTGAARTPEAQRLLDAGVDLTPGQLDPKGFYNQLEENAQSIGFGVGTNVRNARDNARYGVQRAAIEQGSAPGTKITPASQAEMIEQAGKSFTPLYDEAKGFPVTTQIVNTAGPNVPLSQAFKDAIRNRNVLATADDRKNVQNFLENQLTKNIRKSEDLIDLRSDIRNKARERRQRGMDDQAELLDEAETAVTKALESQLPAKPLASLRTADAKYADYKTVEKAVVRSGDRPEGFSPNDLSQAVAQVGKGSNQGSYARGGGGPLRQLASDSRKVLDTRSPPTGQRLLGLVGSRLLLPVVATSTGTQTGRRLAQGALPFQAGVRRATAPLQPALSDPFAEQLALAIQEATRQREGAR